MGVKVKRGYKLEYIPFEQVLKKNFLLQEEVEQLSNKLIVALNTVSQKEQEIEFLITENKRKIEELNQATKILQDRHEMIEEIVKTMVIEQRKNRTMSQENVKLAVKSKESEEKIKELLHTFRNQDIFPVKPPIVERVLSYSKIPVSELSDELTKDVAELTLKDKGEVEEVCKHETIEVNKNERCRGSLQSESQGVKDASLGIDREKSKSSSKQKIIMTNEIDSEESDWLLRKMRDDFRKYELD